MSGIWPLKLSLGHRPCFRAMVGAAIHGRRLKVSRFPFDIASEELQNIDNAIDVNRGLSNSKTADVGNRGIRVLAFGPETDLPCLFVEGRARQLRF